MSITPSSQWSTDELISADKANQPYFIKSSQSLPVDGEEGKDIHYCINSSQFYLYYNSQWNPINISGQLLTHDNSYHSNDYYYQESDLTGVLDDNYAPSGDITWATPLDQSQLASGNEYWNAYQSAQIAIYDETYSNESDLTTILDDNYHPSNQGDFTYISANSISGGIGKFSDIELQDWKLGSPTYDSVHDLVNNTQSAGLISGGTFTDNGDGTVTVAAGTGFIKTTDDALGTTKSFDWSETDITPTDGSLNYVYVDYNSGSPTVNVTTTKSTVTHTNTFLIGKIYQDGNTAHYLEGGTQVLNLARRTQERFGAVEGFERVSGMVVSESGTRNVAITAGKFFRGLNPFTTSAFDSSGSDTFSLWDNNSGTWEESTGETTIPETYDDGSGTPPSLGNNDFGVFWVYMHEDGDVYIVYGTESYNTAALAEAATPRTGLPTKISSMGVLIAQIVISEAAADGFEAVNTPWDTTFTPSLITDHSDLGGLDTGDDHPQYIKDSEFTQDGGILVGTAAGTFAEETGDSVLTTIGLSTNLGDLTDAEVAQLENIGAKTITNTQWGYLGNMGAQPIESETYGNEGDLTADLDDDYHPSGEIGSKINWGVLSQGTGINSFNVVISGTGDTNVSVDSYNKISSNAQSGATALQDVIDDTSPQLGGNLDVNGNEISGLSDPAYNSGAASKHYVDINAGGGISNWSLLQDGNGIKALDNVGVSGAGETVEIDFGGTDTTVASGSHLHDDRYYTETESDNNYYPSSLGNSLSGAFWEHSGNTSNPHTVTSSQIGLSDTDGLAEGTTNKYWDYDADNNQISNVTDPTTAQDASTKNYTDTISSNLNTKIGNKEDTVGWVSIDDGNGIQGFTGKISGSAGQTVQVDFGSTDTTVASGSHKHDDLYYTESESDGLFYPSSTGETLNTDFYNHSGNTSNPHSVTSSDVGLGNVENTALSTAGWGDIGITTTDVSASDVSLDNVTNDAQLAKDGSTELTGDWNFGSSYNISGGGHGLQIHKSGIILPKYAISSGHWIAGDSPPKGLLFISGS